MSGASSWLCKYGICIYVPGFSLVSSPDPTLSRESGVRGREYVSMALAIFTVSVDDGEVRIWIIQCKALPTAVGDTRGKPLETNLCRSYNVAAFLNYWPAVLWFREVTMILFCMGTVLVA